MPGIDIDKKSPPQTIGNNASSSNNGISISPTKRAIMNAFANSLSRSLSMGSFSYKSLGKSLSQMSYGRSPLFDIYQQFKQSVPKNTLPTCVEENDEMLQDIETNFCKDFTCCGMVLKDLHELLQHFEDAHRMESDMEEEDDLPFEFDDLSSNRNNNNSDNYLPTLTDLFLKDLENKQRTMEENNLLNNGMGMQNQPVQQSIAMSDIYSEDKKLIDPVSTLANANTSTLNNNTSFSDILNNKNNNANASTNIQFTSNLSRNNSNSSNLSSKLNNPMTLNIPNTTISSTTSQVSTPTSANTANFNLSKNISAFNSAVSGNVFNPSGNSSQPQTPNVAQTSLPTTPATTTAPTTTTATALAAVTGAANFQAVSNLKNIQKMPSNSNKLPVTLQPSAVSATTLANGMHPIFPNAAVNPYNLLNNKSTVTPFNMMSSATSSSAMNEDQVPQEFDDMDMDMDMEDSTGAGMGEAGSDEEKKYRCTHPGCNKAYKNPGGLKYHLQHGHFEDTGDPEMDKIMTKPYQCNYENCGKRYKNMNGLKYHIEHSHTLFYNQQQAALGLSGNQPNVPLDSQQVLAFQALQMQQLQQLQNIN